MSYLRMGCRAVRLLRRSLLWLLVLAIFCSLIAMGGLIWIDNSWAVLPDDDPVTSFDSSLIIDAMIGEVDCDGLDRDGDGQIPLAGGKLLRGNGDQDDNRPEPLRIVYRPGALIAPVHSPAPVKSWGHQPLKSYLDFGHLKVFPDAVSSLIIEKINCYSVKAATRYPGGSLFWWAASRLLKNKASD